MLTLPTSFENLNRMLMVGWCRLGVLVGIDIAVVGVVTLWALVIAIVVV